MARFLRAAVAVWMIAMLPPCTAAATATHLLVEHAEDATHARETKAGVHGHAHPQDTPEHDHSLLLSQPAVRNARMLAASIPATAAFSANALFVTPAELAFVPRDAVPRAGPPVGSQPILRI